MGSMANVRLALRMLFRTPGVSAVAILSLALGIGANAAIFSLFNQLLLRPLPVREPARLVNLAAPGPKPGSQLLRTTPAAATTSSATRCSATSRSAQTRVHGHRRPPLASARTSRSRGRRIDGDGHARLGRLLPVLGLTPAAGRLLGPDDDRTPGAHYVAVLSHAYWRTRFGSEPGGRRHSRSSSTGSR